MGCGGGGGVEHYKYVNKPPYPEDAFYFMNKELVRTYDDSTGMSNNTVTQKVRN